MQGARQLPGGITREGRRREATPLNADLIPRIPYVFFLGSTKLCPFTKAKNGTIQKELTFKHRKNINTNKILINTYYL